MRMIGLGQLWFQNQLSNKTVNSSLFSFIAYIQRIGVDSVGSIRISSKNDENVRRHCISIIEICISFAI